MKSPEIHQKLRDSKLKIFSNLEFKRLMGCSLVAAQKLLERYTKNGTFIRLKGGLYILKLSYPSSYLIANRLYEPSYISFETALSYYGIIPEIVYETTSATTLPTRQFGVDDRSFSYHTIKKNAFTGYRLQIVEGEKVLFADKEKALADYLYFVFLKKKPWNDRMNLNNIKLNILNYYIKLFDNRRFNNWSRHAF
jgi:predicted transcriptional regulator of viral defense system